jgi:hypothetical protein
MGNNFQNQPGTNQWQPAQPLPKKSNKIHWVGYPVAMVAAFIFGILAGLGAGNEVVNSSTANPEPSVSTTSSAKPTPRPKVVAEKPKSAATTFDGNGIYRVGKDIKPGVYTSNGSLCYWARLSSLDGDLLSIIANSAGGGPQVVTIKKSDKGFKTQGCDNWVMQQ